MPLCPADQDLNRLEVSSFELVLTKRNFIARNNLRLNAVVCGLLILAQLFPIFMPWYADPNYMYEHLPPQSNDVKIDIVGYKKKSRTFIIFSLFSVFVNNEWLTIREFINDGCPYVLTGGFECLQYENFIYASIGVSILTDDNCLLLFLFCAI